MTTHYTARLVITTTETATEVRDRYDKITAAAFRSVDEAASIVVRAETMAALQTKLTAHVALLSGE